MIEGLKIDVPSSELYDLLSERARHHKERAEWYATQVGALREGMAEEARRLVSNDPVQSLGQSQQAHETKAAFFGFMASHAIPNETYRLDESDLIKLEIVSRYFG